MLDVHHLPGMDVVSDELPIKNSDVGMEGAPGTPIETGHARAGEDVDDGSRQHTERLSADHKRRIGVASRCGIAEAADILDGYELAQQWTQSSVSRLRPKTPVSRE